MLKKALSKVGEKRQQLANDDSGFTLMEMVIAIPIIALTGTFIMAVIGSSITTINNNATLSQAAAETQSVVKSFQESNNCYQLETKVAENEEREVEMKSGRTFNIMVPTVECEKGTANEVVIEAVQGSGDSEKVIYKTSTAVFISE